MAECIDRSDEQLLSKKTQNYQNENVNPAKNVTKRRTDDSLRNPRTKIVKQLNAHEIRNRYNLNGVQIDNEQLYQQQFDNLVANKLKYSTLTQQELNILFLKYKSDRHYKPTETFVTFFHKQCTVNNRSHYDQFPDMQQKSGNSFDACNQAQYVQDNSKYVAQGNGEENQYLYFSENYNHSNHAYRNCNVQPYNNTNNAESYDYSNDRIPASDEYYSCGLMNPTNISSQNCRYGDTTVLCDLSNSNQLYENSQQNYTSFLPQYNNYGVNLNYDDYLLNTWNNKTTANNTWSQSRNTQYHNQMEHYNNRNSSYQFTGYNFEEQNNFNALNHNEAYFKSYGDYFNENNTEQDLNNYLLKPSIADALFSYMTDIPDN